MDLCMSSFSCNLENADSCIDVSSSMYRIHTSAESIASDVCPVCNTKKETLAKREELTWQREAILLTREKELREYELLLGKKKCVLNEREKRLQVFIDSGAVVSSEISSAKHSRRSSVSIADFDTLNCLQGESDAKNNELLDEKEKQIFEKENLIDIKTKNLQVREENIISKELLLNEQKALFQKEEELAKERYNDLKMREKIIIKMEESFHANFEAIKENKKSLEDDYKLLIEKENILSVAEEIIASREKALKEREEKVDKVLYLLKQADISMKTILTNDKLNKYSDFFQNINELFNLKWVSIEQRENLLKQNELILEEKWTNYYKAKGLLKAEDEEQRNNKGFGENSRLFTERLEKESNMKASPDLDVILPQEGQLSTNQQVSLHPICGSNTNEKEGAKTNNFQMESLENAMKNKVHDSEITGSTQVFENRMSSDAITNCDSMKLHLGAKVCSNQPPELSENRVDVEQGNVSVKFVSLQKFLEKTENVPAINNMSQKSVYVVNGVSVLQRTIDKMQKTPEQEVLEPGRLKQQCLVQQGRQGQKGLEQKRTTLEEVVQESWKPERRVSGSSVCEGRLPESLLHKNRVPEGQLSASRAQYSRPDKGGRKFQEQKRQDRVSYKQEGRVQRGRKPKEFLQERLGNGHQKYRQPRNQNQVNPQRWDKTSKNCVKNPLRTAMNHSLKIDSNSGFKVIGNKIDGGGDTTISKSSLASSPGYMQEPVSKAISPWQNETFANDALLQAISNEKYLEIVQLLAHNKVRVLLRARNDLGQSPFLLAVKKRNIELVERLIHMDVNKRECDYSGCSALHLAVINNDTNMVHFLLRQGLNVCVTDNDGLTAAQLAHKLNYSHLVMIINSHS